MTVPTLILQAVFVIATGACFLLVGVALGATIFADLGGHGLATIGSILKGACIGAATGCAIAILLIIKYQFGKKCPHEGCWCIATRHNVYVPIYSGSGFPGLLVRIS